MNALPIPPHLLEPQTAEEALQIIGFVRNDLGAFTRSWGNMKFGGVRWLGLLHVMGSYTSKREIATPQFVFAERVAPIEILAAVSREWLHAHPEAPAPKDLLWGKTYAEHKRLMRSLIPPGPTIWAAREFFRFCLSYVERLNGDWADKDYEIAFSLVPGQLEIRAGETVAFCPARGQWPRTSVVSAREFFRRVPKRFTGKVVVLREEGKYLAIDSHKVKARWIEASDDAVDEGGVQPQSSPVVSG